MVVKGERPSAHAVFVSCLSSFNLIQLNEVKAWNEHMVVDLFHIISFIIMLFSFHWKRHNFYPFVSEERWMDKRTQFHSTHSLHILEGTTWCEKWIQRTTKWECNWMWTISHAAVELSERWTEFSRTHHSRHSLKMGTELMFHFLTLLSSS